MGKGGGQVSRLVHDLSPEEWARVSREYDGWDIVSDNGIDPKELYRQL